MVNDTAPWSPRQTTFLMLLQTLFVVLSCTMILSPSSTIPFVTLVKAQEETEVSAATTTPDQLDFNQTTTPTSTIPSSSPQQQQLLPLRHRRSFPPLPTAERLR